MRDLRKHKGALAPGELRKASDEASSLAKCSDKDGESSTQERSNDAHKIFRSRGRVRTILNKVPLNSIKTISRFQPIEACLAPAPAFSGSGTVDPAFG